jgi:hypothetical protein
MATTSTFKPAANTDNNTWGPDFYSGDINDYSNMGKPTAYEWHSSMRFPSVTVPAKAIITSAKITLNAYWSHSNTDVNVKIYGNDVDNAVAPTTFGEAQGLVLTTAYTLWSAIPAWTMGTNYDTPDLKTIIQEIIDRSGWASGQAIQIVIRNNSSSDLAGRQYSNFKKGADVCPILTITYYTQWSKKINSVSTPAKVYGVSNAAVTGVVYKINTVSR